MHVPIVRSSLPATPIVVEEHQELAPPPPETRPLRPAYEAGAREVPHSQLGPQPPGEEPRLRTDASGAPEALSLSTNGIPSAPASSQYPDPTLPLWPDTTIKLPDPFEEDIPHTPVERKEFSDPLNIAAPIHADERPPLVLPHDPSLESQSVWE